jgi:GNAT superfamily N-acetyltransferase
MVREAEKEDLAEILQLYLFLHETEVPAASEQLTAVWNSIILDENHHLIVNVIEDRIVSSCICVIIPNLTRSIRPYAFIENVVTHGDYRGRGYATDCLNYARSIAEKENCYKMMLLTGSKEHEVLRFYQNAGYNNTDKTAFIRWID